VRRRPRTWEHQVLERLGAAGRAVDEADGAVLHARLAVLAPEPQLPVVPLLLVGRRGHDARILLRVWPWREKRFWDF